MPECASQGCSNHVDDDTGIVFNHRSGTHVVCRDCCNKYVAVRDALQCQAGWVATEAMLYRGRADTFAVNSGAGLDITVLVVPAKPAQSQAEPESGPVPVAEHGPDVPEVADVGSQQLH